MGKQSQYLLQKEIWKHLNDYVSWNIYWRFVTYNKNS